MTNKWQWLSLAWTVIVWTFLIAIVINVVISDEWNSLTTLIAVLLLGVTAVPEPLWARCG
jgi:type IV secretory pathway TrbL component